MEISYLPSTWVEDVDPNTNITIMDMAMDIPSNNPESPHYLIVFDNGSQCSVVVTNMPT